MCIKSKLGVIMVTLSVASFADDTDESDPVQEPRTYSWCNDYGTRLITDAENWMIQKSDPHEYGIPTIIDTIDSFDGDSAYLTNGTFEAKNFIMGRWSNVPATLNISNGVFAIADNVTIARYDSAAMVNVYGGYFNAKSVSVGHWESGNASLNVYGGEVSVTGGWPGSISIGVQSKSRGDMRIVDGKVTAGSTVQIGYSDLTKYGGPSADTASTLTVEGGEMSVTDGGINVGAADEGINGGGHLMVKGGALNVSGNVNIVTSSNGWGQVDFSGGKVTIDGNTYIGNHPYGKHAVLNISNCELDCADISISRECSSELNISHASLNVNCINKDLNAPASAYVKVFIDGGTLIAKSDQSYFLSSSNEIVFGPDGMIMDTDGHNITVQAYAAITGLGGITKKGEGKLELIANSFGYAGTYVAHGPIVVEQGTLRMPANQTIYCTATRVADGAELDLNGSTIVIVTKKVAKSVWTNAAGDADATNPINWTSDIVFFDASGNEIPSIAETIQGVLPTEDTVVRIPLNSAQPSNMSDLSVYELDYVTSADLSLINDMGATYDEYVASSLVIAGNLKIDNKLNSVLKSAAVWYDPSDMSTLVIGEETTFTGDSLTYSYLPVTQIVNKGTAGTALNGYTRDKDDNCMYTIFCNADDSPFNLPTLFFTNVVKTVVNNDGNNEEKGQTAGFVSSNGSITTTNNQDRAFFTVTRGVAGELHAISSAGVNNYWSGDDQNYWGFGSFGKWMHANITNQNWDYGLGTSDFGYVDLWNNSCVSYERLKDKVVTGNIYSGNEHAWKGEATYVLPGDTLTLENRISYGSRLIYGGRNKVSYLGESLFFDKTLSDTATRAIGGYLAGKWLGETDAAPEIGETSISILKLENATVDFDNAPVAIGALGGSGAIAKANGVTVARKLFFDLDADGEMPKIEIDCAVEASRANVECSEALYAAMLAPGAPKTVVLVEAPEINFGASRHIECERTGHLFIVYKKTETRTVGEETVTVDVLTLKRDNGFTISIR